MSLGDYDLRLVRINQLNPCRKVGDNLGLQLLQPVRKIRRLQYIGTGLQSDWVTSYECSLQTGFPELLLISIL